MFFSTSFSCKAKEDPSGREANFVMMHRREYARMVVKLNKPQPYSQMQKVHYSRDDYAKSSGSQICFLLGNNNDSDKGGDCQKGVSSPRCMLTSSMHCIHSCNVYLSVCMYVYGACNPYPIFGRIQW